MPGSARALDQTDGARNAFDTFEWRLRHRLTMASAQDQEDVAKLMRELVTALKAQAEERAHEDFGRHRNNLSKRINTAWIGIAFTVLGFAVAVGVEHQRVANLESQIAQLQGNSQTVTELKVRTEAIQHTVDRIQEILDQKRR